MSFLEYSQKFAEELEKEIMRRSKMKLENIDVFINSKPNVFDDCEDDELPLTQDWIDDAYILLSKLRLIAIEAKRFNQEVRNPVMENLLEDLEQ